MRTIALALLLLFCAGATASAQGTRLLRQPTVSATHVAFAYGGDLWVVGREGGEARRLTSSPAVDADPQFSPDGRWIAYTSNRSGNNEVYVIPAAGGEPVRLTWHPAEDEARGWTPDGASVLFSSERETAPSAHPRLWTVGREGGVPKLLPAPWGIRGSYSADGKRLAVDRVGRWDVEWRNYRGGQNTPLVILDLGSLDEVRLPNERTTDTRPAWVGNVLYFLSDRDFATNVWAYDVGSKALRQVTKFTDADVKELAAGPGTLVIEQDGYIHLVDPATGSLKRLDITVRGDFPWADPKWTDVSRSIADAALSPTGKRALFEARGEIFTVPVDKGDPRNLTRSAGSADRSPMWAPNGREIAWFSDAGKGYVLRIAPQDGIGATRDIPLGDAKFAYAATWSPDGSRIAFADDHAKLRVLELATGKLTTVDTDGSLWNREGLAPAWSPDSKWLAYAKLFDNQFRRVMVWSVADGQARPITDPMADAISPAWDRNGRWLYLLASTDAGLTTGWANISSIGRQVTRGVYLTLLRATDSTPFAPESDDEPAVPAAPAAKPAGDSVRVTIDFDGIARRILPLQLPVRDYDRAAAAATGVLFVRETQPNGPPILHRYDVAKRKVESFLTGVTGFALSGDGKKLLYRAGPQWAVVGTDAPPKPGDGALRLSLMAQLDPKREWPQIVDEAWRLERDFFYDPGNHGADMDAVYRRYAPLVPYIRHRADLNYVIDQIGGELSVGHSFVFGGDLPAVDTTRIGLLGADLRLENGRWRIARIYTGESWNPDLRAPLDQPGLRVRRGDYLLGVNGVELSATEDPGRAFDGTADRQTVLRLNDRPSTEGSWTVTVVPLRSDNNLRTRAWVEDNRRAVDSLSGGKLGYVWVPNTGGGGYDSFNRYYFAQQDKQGAVIDERFNGGGLLDDYWVILMTRRLVAGVTNDAGGTPFRLPIAGIPGPKVLLINEMAGSGGDFFPWAFRTYQVGPLIGARTWGGLVASCVPYPLVDGGAITSPCSAIFDLKGNWVAENEGVPPDIEVLLDAKSVAAGRDPQLERGVKEALRLLSESAPVKVTPPPFPVRAKRPPASRP
jgi:tricorn protease